MAFVLNMQMRAVRRGFLDRKRVINGLRRRDRRNLAKIGGMTRTIARRSMKPRRKLPRTRWPKQLTRVVNAYMGVFGRRPHIPEWVHPLTSAEPRPAIDPSGKGPKYGKSRGIKDAVFFAADVDKRSVVTGPVSNNRQGRVLELLEHGGRAQRGLPTYWVRNIDGSADGEVGLSRNNRQPVTYEGHHYMERSFNQTLDTIVPGLWKDSLR